MDKKDAIAEAAARQLAAVGLASFTVARVARAARASSALIHYHFSTKQRLLWAAAERLAVRRTASRLGALEGARGLAALDALWAVLLAGSARDAERGWHDLVLLARGDGEVASILRRERDREIRGLAAALPRLLADLDSRPRIGREDLASLFVTCLDGLSSALALGAQPAELKGAYDAFCLALVALGQPPPGR